VSRLLTALGHEVIVGHAQKVRLITKSRRKDDRLDAQTLARIDPKLLSPMKHRNAQPQLHLAEIRARALTISLDEISTRSLWTIANANDLQSPSEPLRGNANWAQFLFSRSQRNDALVILRSRLLLKCVSTGVFL
jgi:hypothetical protein